MLELKNIKKRYVVADTYTDALKGVSLAFRENEFVAILGPSGCGKTTLLNIIGGLDKSTDGDLIINGKSTKNFTDHDFDSYRNNYIGFVFQSYNLISHQSVLANVELSLTLSGVSKAERTRRAKEALIRVGLEEQIYKKPNQLSGGQMQRVAIARAIVNNPKIVLADEPTGALDTTTSVQIMDILKEISKECLIIMVTHNPDLADKYATRTINLLNGEVTSDDNPLNKEELKQLEKEKEIENAKSPKEKKVKKVSMSLWTAISLSFKNLLTKKARTILTAFAGSIGIIGIALILSLSSGFQKYIDNIEEDTLSSYPLTISQTNTDISGLTSLYTDQTKINKEEREDGKVYSNDFMSNFLSSSAFEVKQNDLASFKNYLEEHKEELKDAITDIEYVYNLNFNIYSPDYDVTTPDQPYKLQEFSFGSNDLSLRMLEQFINNNVWSQMIGDEDFIKSQYTLKAGHWPTAYNEVVLVLDENGGINDYYLYALGVKTKADVDAMLAEKEATGKIESKNESFEYSDFLNRKYKLLLDCEYFIKDTDDRYNYISETTIARQTNPDYSPLKQIIEDKGIELTISAIVQQNTSKSGISMGGVITYTKALTDYCVDHINNAEIIVAQKASETNVVKNLNGGVFSSYFTKDYSMKNYMGVVDKDNPQSINIYSASFEGKDAVKELINQYNKQVENEAQKISYSDYVAFLMESISTIINAISYVLIAFVSISLIVSSIMIAIITYISVLERTKEIGVLRSIGASKQDIKRVFNAETLIIGFISGLLGVTLTVLLNIPINAIIYRLADIKNIAGLPFVAALVLITISVVLTLISGLVPASMAAKRDPVVALRSE